MVVKSVLQLFNPAAPSAGISTAIVIDEAPVAADDTLFAHETALIHGNVFADNGHGLDFDPEGDALRVVEVMSQESYVGLGINLIAGRVRILADGTFWFDTAGDFGYLVGGETVEVSFDYTVADAAGATSTATATVTITGANNAPLLYPDFVYTHENAVTKHDVFAFNGVGIDTDPEGGNLRVVDFMGGTVAAGGLAELPDGGLVRLMADGTLWFRANGAYDAMRPGEVEEVTFTYRASDGQFTRTSHVTLMIEGRNTAPVARPDSFTTLEDRSAGGLLFADNGAGADSDVEGDGFVVSRVNGDKANVGVSFDLPEGGRLRVMENGQFWFNPLNDYDYLNEGETETVSFTYTVDDRNGGSSQATVEVMIGGISYLQVLARDDAFSTAENTILTRDFLVDDYEDPDDEPEVISVSFATSGPGTYAGPEGGILTLGADGRSFTFDPGDDFDYLRKNTQESFDFIYEIEDRNGTRSDATVSIIVNGSNDAPIAFDDHFVWSLSGANSSMNVFTDNGAGADYDVDIGDTLEVRAFKPSSFSVYRSDNATVNLPGGGTAKITTDGDIILGPTSDGDYYTDGGELEAGDRLVLDYRIQDDFETQSSNVQIYIDIIA
jgi:VCBS repeat-containing protein